MSCDAGTAATAAAGLKEEGNAAFSAQDYVNADRLYTEAIQLDPTSAPLHSNRCAARTSLGRHLEALADAERACELDENWPRGPVRKITTLTALERYADAIESGREAADRFPDDAAIAGALKRAIDAQTASAVKADVVDFAVNKSIGEAAVRSGDYLSAEQNYSKTIETMEGLIGRLPAEQAAPIRAQIEVLRTKMRTELGNAQASNTRTDPAGNGASK
jgi:tetratricopeptide (TPR) repeat protein